MPVSDWHIVNAEQTGKQHGELQAQSVVIGVVTDEE